MPVFCESQTTNGRSVRIRIATDEDVELKVTWQHDRRVNVWYGGVEEDDPAAIREDWKDPWCRKGIIVVGGTADTGGADSTDGTDGTDVGYIQWYDTDEEIENTFRLPHGPRYWGIDVFIGVPELFSQGIGTDAVRALSDKLLNEDMADVVIIDPHERNARAIRSYQKAGFEFTHLLPHHEFSDGEWHDAVLLTKRKASS